MAEHMAIEKKHQENLETLKWKTIGLFKLTEYSDKYPFDGPRPIMTLVDMTQEDLFRKQANCVPVKVIKVCEGEDGIYVDDTKHGQFNGVVILYGYSGRRQEKHLQSELFQLTLEDGAPKLQSAFYVLDGFRMNAESLEQMKDEHHMEHTFDRSQLMAAAMALNDHRKLVCIQGPPGTGKTRTLAFIIYNLLKDGKTAMVLTPTREALSNILSATTIFLERMKFKVQEYELSTQKMHEDFLNKNRSEEVVEELTNIQNKFAAQEISQQDYDAQLLALKKKLSLQFIRKAKIIFSTISAGFVDFVARCGAFRPSVCIIDEAAQVMEAQTWPSVPLMPRIVMAGDPHQLPALVLTPEGKEYGLETSIMERLSVRKSEYSWVILNNQYRSHSAIMEWSSKAFYNDELKHCVENNLRLLKISSGDIRLNEKLYGPLVMIDTSLETDKVKIAESWEDVQISTNTSKTYFNKRESEIVVQHYSNLLGHGIKHEDIAIISPYRGQTELIRSMLFSRDPDNAGKFAVGTVDSYQGKEFDAVIFSLVRNNPSRTLGFVSNLRRLNVAITRAKKHFMLVGNGWMLSVQRQQQIKDLFEKIRYDRNRLPPDYVFGDTRGEINNDPNLIKNNFGKDFREFIAVCKDPEMKKPLIDYLEGMNDPQRQLARESCTTK
ncbi:unnamed protein product [Caenorhabditis sp. 36 PRJEB53466]|nr:unnamed protein product [Caenorhabditis sp. 36 PRJEB53466]